MLNIFDGNLDIDQIQKDWLEKIKGKNCGAYVSFVGIVRDENAISGLSFDVHEGMLQTWFKKWEDKLAKLNSYVFMAHSCGDVSNHESSFICAIVSPQRRVALEQIDEFVEDFKANAPIWKYELKNAQRIYASAKSKPLPNAGLLG